METTKPVKLHPKDITAILYHYPCDDGTTAAFLAKRFMLENYPDKQVELVPMKIDAAPPAHLLHKDAYLLICDYSFKANITRELIDKCGGILVLDHHATNQKELADIPDQYKVFDMTKSGASLTWEYFYPGINVPPYIKYVEDRDLYLNKMPDAAAFVAWHETLSHEPEDLMLREKYIGYDKYLNANDINDPPNTERWTYDYGPNIELLAGIEKGRAFNELRQRIIKAACGYSSIKFMQIKVNNVQQYYFVAYAANSANLMSDIGNTLMRENPIIDFAAVFAVDSGVDKTNFSLRSLEGRTNVATIAEQFRGGGHPCASGCQVHYVTNHLPGAVLDVNKLHKCLNAIYCADVSGDLYDVDCKPTLISIAYLNANKLKRNLAKYLLQSDHIVTKSDQTPHQNAIRLLKLAGRDCLSIIHVACVWSYDENKDVTEMVVEFDKSLSYEEVSSIRKHTNLTNDKIKVKGLHKELVGL